MRYHAKVERFETFEKESARVRRAGKDPEDARVRADREGLWLDGERALPRDEIARAYVQPAHDSRRASVRLETYRFFADVEIDVRDAAEGESLLRALGLDAPRDTITFRMMCERPIGANHGWQIGMVGLGVAAYASAHSAMMQGQGPGLLAWVFLPLMIAGSVMRRWLSASVGADGVLLSQWGDERFVSYESIDRVSANARGVVLTLASGERLALRATSPRHHALSSALAERIDEGLAAYRSREPAPRPAALVARGGRPVVSWLESLRALPQSRGSDDYAGGPGGAYRTVAVPAETLWRIVEDPTAEESERVGAAVALGASALDEDGRSRLASAARASASPRVRVVLEHAARGDDEDEELVAALEACGPASARRPGS